MLDFQQGPTPRGQIWVELRLQDTIDDDDRGLHPCLELLRRQFVCMNVTVRKFSVARVSEKSLSLHHIPTKLVDCFSWFDRNPFALRRIVGEDI